MIKSEYHKYIDTLFESAYELPGYQHLTDLEGRLLSVNKNLVVAAGISESSIIGKTVFCEQSRQFEKMYKGNERRVIETLSNIVVYELAKSHDGRVFSVLTQKSPIYYDGCLIGVWGNSIEQPRPNIAIENLFCERDYFFDSKRGRLLTLTKKQKIVLLHILEGLTAKETAEKLFLSKRTVEHHIEAIKNNNEYNSLRELVFSVSLFKNA